GHQPSRLWRGWCHQFHDWPRCHAQRGDQRPGEPVLSRGEYRSVTSTSSLSGLKTPLVVLALVLTILGDGYLELIRLGSAASSSSPGSSARSKKLWRKFSHPPSMFRWRSPSKADPRTSMISPTSVR